MNVVEEAFKKLYPKRNYNYNVKLKYSGRFSSYNANIKLTGFYNLEIKLSKSWKGVNREIVIGLIQDLLLKIFGGKKISKNSTLNIRLYNTFIKNLHLSVPKDKIDPTLKRSFDRINDQFFSGQVELPNLIWGPLTRRKLACYNFHTDTISVSKIFQYNEIELLDYVMYHEILHKVLKFDVSKTNHRYHTTNFRKAEKAYPNQEELEKRLRYLSVKEKKRSIFAWFTK